MSNIASIALSGMNAASLHMGASAHNVANLQTPGFRRQVATQQSMPQGGVAVTLSQATTVGDALAEDIVQQMSSSHAFAANLLTFRTENRMLGTLLDLTA
jgi:flagellar hook protein FlgE